MPSKRSIILVLWVSIPTSACKGDGDSSRVLTFSGGHEFLPGFEIDTGWVPEDGPAGVRLTASALGRVDVATQATTDGAMLLPVSGSSNISLEGALKFDVSARIDASGVTYEGIIDTFEYAIALASMTFEGFAIEQPVILTADLPPQELGRVPIPSVPGSTFVFEITGGHIDTSFQGSCATMAGGFAQVTGTTTTSGAIETGSSIEIDVPIVGSKTFGPFEVTIPIPEVVQDVDLGTLSLSSGELVDDQGVCSGATGDDEGGSTTGTSESEGDSGEDSGSTTRDATGDSTTSSDGTATGTTGYEGPNYPMPDGIECPRPDQVPIQWSQTPDNVVCLEPCDAMGECPAPDTGNARAVCDLPGYIGASCMEDAECGPLASCTEGTCDNTSSHCRLYCDMGETCPDGMICYHGNTCTYPL